MEVTNEGVYTRLFNHYTAYLFAVVKEAKQRDTKTITQSLDDYMELTLLTGGVQTTFDMILLPFSIPQHILEDHRVQKLERLANELIVTFNVSAI